LRDYPKCHGLRRWEDEIVFNFTSKGDFVFKKKEKYQVLGSSFDTADSQGKYFVAEQEVSMFFPMVLGKNNWDAVILLSGQLNCFKPHDSQGSAERRTCQNSCLICCTTAGDVLEPSSTFCWLWSRWVPPKPQPAFTPLPHPWDELNQFRVGSVCWLGKNLLTENNTVSVVGGAGQEDSFSWRRLKLRRWSHRL